MNKIILYGHDSSKKWLEEIEKDVYKLKGNITFYNIGVNPDKNHHYLYVDPDGGPMIRIGDILNGKEIIDIEQTNDGIYFTLKPTVC